MLLAPVLWVREAELLQDAGNNTGTHRTATFADSKAHTLLNGDRVDQLYRHLDAIAGHNHFSRATVVGGKRFDAAGYVGRPHVELRLVSREEGVLRPPSFSVRM